VVAVGGRPAPTRQWAKSLESRSDHARSQIATDRSPIRREDPSRPYQLRAKINFMRPRIWLILIVQAALVSGTVLAVASRRVPLGVPGEWEWLRVKFPPVWIWLGLGGLAVVAYAGFVAVGFKAIATRSSRRVEAAWLAGLAAAAVAIQVTIPLGAASGYDHSKWAAANYLPGSAGYFKIARQQALRDPWRFLEDYPRWIEDQDSLHIGTHPPGLIAVQCFLIRVMDSQPSIADLLLDHMPAAVDQGFRAFADRDPQPLSRADRAALYATALLTLFACALTVVPLYLLARVALPARAAWAAAALWPLVPAANLFQPVADTAYPLPSTSALALAAWSAWLFARSGRPARVAVLLAIASGTVMAFGMFFTLAFLPVGLIVALVVASQRALSWRSRGLVIGAVGLGFTMVILCGWASLGANPFVIGWWNLHHHARFYDEYPRTYWLWLVVNPVELAIALGLPAVVWFLSGLFSPRGMPVSVWATILVLVLTNLTGRNMGEVARLWLLYLPPLLVGAGYGFDRWASRPAALGVSTALVGLQTLALQAMIQVVYPV
jgi:methylthioxylose transferase